MATRYFINEDGFKDFRNIDMVAIGDPEETVSSHGIVQKTSPMTKLYAYHSPASEDPNVNSSQYFGQLFTHTPAETSIAGAYAHRKLRSAIPIMASYLHKRFGGRIEASEDLSEHSSKLVRHAWDLGLPVRASRENPHAKQTNNMDFDDRHLTTTDLEGYANSDWYTEIPHSEIVAAKEHYRELRGYKRPQPKNHLSQQFTQPQLPGMED